MKIIFVTQNSKKIETAQRVLSLYGIEIDQLKIEINEIQTSSIETSCLVSATYASKFTSELFITSSVGYFINCLNGFPGLYTSYINQTLSSEQILAMITGSDRSFTVKTGVCLYDPKSQTSKVFISESFGEIAQHPFGEGTSLDRIMIRNGQNKVQSLYTYDEMIEYYSHNMSHYHQIGKYLNNMALA